jgi:hypothetical protein
LKEKGECPRGFWRGKASRFFFGSPRYFLAAMGKASLEPSALWGVSIFLKRNLLKYA